MMILKIHLLEIVYKLFTCRRNIKFDINIFIYNIVCIYIYYNFILLLLSTKKIYGSGGGNGDGSA